MLAWSHIFLGRIKDVEDDRDGAIAEYKAALTVRDGQPDTKEAAETGLKKPFALPHQAEDDSSSQAAPTLLRTAGKPAASAVEAAAAGTALLQSKERQQQAPMESTPKQQSGFSERRGNSAGAGGICGRWKRGWRMDLPIRGCWRLP